MLKFIKKEYKYLLILFFILVASFSFFWLKQAFILMDVGREFYIPSQMNKGLVLYRDIVNVYSPLGYQLNALLFKIFGENISTLYNFGVLNACIIIFGIYLLSREFLSKKYSLLISVLMAAIYIASSSRLFNYVIPYTYAMPYALSSFIFSVFFLIKYIKKSNVKYFYFAAFLGGMSLDFKLEYVLYPFVLLYTGLLFKPLKRVEIINSFLCFILMPLISLSVLVYQGAALVDFFNAFEIMRKMVESPATQFFYKKYSGFIFSWQVLYFCVVTFLTLLFVFLILSVRKIFYERVKKINVYFFDLVLAVALISILYSTFLRLLSPLFLINLILFLLFAKDIFKNKPLFIMAICTITAAIKSFFVFIPYSYGVFSAPFLLISIIAIICFTSDNKKKDNFIIESIKFNLQFFITILIILFFYYNFLRNTDQAILDTPKGHIFVKSSIAQLHKPLIDFIIENTEPSDRIVILPETPFLNFVTDRASNNFYMCLIPIYVDVFGEKNIISDFKKDMPEYFILNNRDCSEYGFQYFGLDFAKGIKQFIDEKYVFVKEFHSGKDVMIIYKRKDIK